MLCCHGFEDAEYDTTWENQDIRTEQMNGRSEAQCAKAWKRLESWDLTVGTTGILAMKCFLSGTKGSKEPILRITWSLAASWVPSTRYDLTGVTAKNVSKHCQMSPGDQNAPQLRTTTLTSLFCLQEEFFFSKLVLMRYFNKKIKEMKHWIIICSHFLFSVEHLEINGIFNSGRFYHPLPFKEPSSVSPAEKWLPFSCSLSQFQFSLASGFSVFLFELSGFPS